MWENRYFLFVFAEIGVTTRGIFYVTTRVISFHWWQSTKGERASGKNLLFRLDRADLAGDASA